MSDAKAEVRWARRVSKTSIRRLYESDAQGLLDEEMLDEVGMALYARCESILTVYEARDLGRVRCPVCERVERRVVIQRQGGLEERLSCPECGWSLTWHEYRRTFQRRQLNSGGALPAFQAFVRAYALARTPQQKMLAVDRLLHEYHYSVKGQPDVPTRAVAVNLLDGRLTDVVAFLDELTYGVASTPGLAETRVAWRTEGRRVPWRSNVADEDETD